MWYRTHAVAIVPPDEQFYGEKAEHSLTSFDPPVWKGWLCDNQGNHEGEVHGNEFPHGDDCLR